MSLKFPISLVGKRAAAVSGPPEYSGTCSVIDPTKSYVWDNTCTPILGSPITGDIPPFLNNFGNFLTPRVYIGTGCSVIGNFSFFLGNIEWYQSELYISEGVTRIGDAAFQVLIINTLNGDGVLNLPSTLTTINGYSNFGNCSGITRVNIWSLNPPTFEFDQTGQEIFKGTSITEVHVPAGGTWGAKWGSNDVYDVIADL